MPQCAGSDITFFGQILYAEHIAYYVNVNNIIIKLNNNYNWLFSLFKLT